MPEGDTIHRAATRLRPVLAGSTVASFRAPRLIERGPAPGTAIVDVEARGKYLLVHFGDGTTLETHMKMTGSWHIYRRGERWRRSPSAAVAVIETSDDWVAVCFSAPHVKLTRSADGPDHLGPDLCTPDADLAEAVRRFGLRPGDTPIAVALADQRICCGVGNVYKSEVLFACGIDPDTPVAALDEGERAEIVAAAHRLLRQNLGAGPRVTVAGSGRPGLAVYRRRGQPCIECGTAIEYGTHGPHHRSTYWCPACQPPKVAE